MRVPSQVDVDRIVRIDLVELLDNINRRALGFAILGLYPGMCQDDDRIDALIAQNFFIMSNGFGFIKNLIILIVVIERQNRQIGRLNADKADFNNLVITGMNFLDDVRLKTIWNLAIVIISLGALENHVGRNNVDV